VDAQGKKRKCRELDGKSAALSIVEPRTSAQLFFEHVDFLPEV
jgi:hypothetical protein